MRIFGQRLRRTILFHDVSAMETCILLYVCNSPATGLFELARSNPRHHLPLARRK